VTQAELLAVINLVDKLSVLPEDTHVDIFVDNKGVVESLISPRPVKGFMLEGFSAPNALVCAKKVTLHWIPEHNGYTGNKAADRLAKEACAVRFPGRQPATAVPNDMIRRAIRLCTWLS